MTRCRLRFYIKLYWKENKSKIHHLLFRVTVINFKRENHGHRYLQVTVTNSDKRITGSEISRISNF